MHRTFLFDPLVVAASNSAQLPGGAHVALSVTFAHFQLHHTAALTGLASRWPQVPLEGDLGGIAELAKGAHHPARGQPDTIGYNGQPRIAGEGIGFACSRPGT